MVEYGGVEPPTHKLPVAVYVFLAWPNEELQFRESTITVQCAPKHFLVDRAGFEPTAPAMRMQCSTPELSAQENATG